MDWLGSMDGGKMTHLGKFIVRVAVHDIGPSCMSIIGRVWSGAGSGWGGGGNICLDFVVDFV